MAYEGPEVDQGDPWGYRHQFNIADSGFGARGPRVQNDRAGEVGRTLNVKDFDLDRIFGTGGRADRASVRPDRRALAGDRQVLPGTRPGREEARHPHLFDLNYRASFWKGREKELRGASSPRSPAWPTSWSATRRTSSSAWASKVPRPAARDLAAKIEGFKGMIERVKKAYPERLRLRHDAARGRQRQPPPLGRDHARHGDQWHVVEPREIGVLDRIGGGDGFVGGMLYAILQAAGSRRSGSSSAGPAARWPPRC